MIAVTTLLQRRFIGIFRLMIALAVPKPPDALPERRAAQAARRPRA